MKLNFLAFACASTFAVATKAEITDQNIDAAVASLHDQVITWRQDIHEHPELGYQETRTAALVAEHLKKLGIEVKTGVGRTGVVGIIKGAPWSGSSNTSGHGCIASYRA